MPPRRGKMLWCNPLSTTGRVKLSVNPSPPRGNAAAAECWLLSSCTKRLQLVILRIPGNSRGNFWVVKIPGIPGGLDGSGIGGITSVLGPKCAEFLTVTHYDFRFVQLFRYIFYPPRFRLFTILLIKNSVKNSYVAV